MTYFSNSTIERLQEAVDLPDLSGTRYTLVRHIARGGMGAVYLVEDANLERQVAMKVLDTTIESEELSVRLRKEARIVATLEHPGIVPLHDVGVLPDGRLYYTMKFVQGKQLDEYVTPGMSIAERLRIFQKICEAVAFAHSKHIIHRDLKPQNVMVGSFGEVLVMDWGVAKHLDSESAVTAPIAGTSSGKTTTLHGTVIGTPAYMSPEQQRGETNTVDERSDVFSLGAILHFLLTGVSPAQFSGSLRKANPKIHKSIEAVCCKALSPNHNERYGSVADLSMDITHFLDGEPVGAYRESILEKLDRWIGKNRFLVFLILAYLLMRILLLVASGR
jgi:serine/threonine protein kinase